MPCKRRKGIEDFGGIPVGTHGQSCGQDDCLGIVVGEKTLHRGKRQGQPVELRALQDIPADFGILVHQSGNDEIAKFGAGRVAGRDSDSSGVLDSSRDEDSHAFGNVGRGEASDMDVAVPQQPHHTCDADCEI